MAETQLDPYALLQALDRHRVTYILIGGFARIVQGTEEMTYGLDFTPSLRVQNLERLERALRELEARRADGHELSLAPEPLGGLATVARYRDRARLGAEKVQVGFEDVRHDKTRTDGERLVDRRDRVADQTLKLMKCFLVMRFARSGGSGKNMAKIVNSRHAVGLPIGCRRPRGFRGSVTNWTTGSY